MGPVHDVVMNTDCSLTGACFVCSYGVVVLHCVMNTDCSLNGACSVCSYGVVVTGQRGTRPHICSREEILKDAVTNS